MSALSAVGALVGLVLALFTFRFGLWLATLAEGYGWEVHGTLTARDLRWLRRAQRSTGALALVFVALGLYGTVDSVRVLAATL